MYGRMRRWEMLGLGDTGLTSECLAATMRRSVVAAWLPVCLPNAIGDRPYPGGGTWACLDWPGVQLAAACGPKRALLFRKPRLAPAAKVLIDNERQQRLEKLSP